jgi:hypothetical protein
MIDNDLPAFRRNGARGGLVMSEHLLAFALQNTKE